MGHSVTTVTAASMRPGTNDATQLFHPVIIVCGRIIEEEREVRRQRPQSFLGSEAKEDSKVISHQRKVILGYILVKQNYLNSKSLLTLKVSLANSKAVFGLRVEPSRRALSQSSYPWQVLIDAFSSFLQ